MDWLPQDGATGALVGRAWLPAGISHGGVAGPAVVAIRPDGVFDLSATFPTVSGLLEHPDAAARVRLASGPRVGAFPELAARQPASGEAHFLAPCDLQVIKAAGVTFAASLLERVIEEQAKGDPARAEAVRTSVTDLLGGSLAAVVPGSAKAAELRQVLVRQGLWSQYLEVGIGADAEVFTKAPVLSAVGPGAEVGIHSASSWNNPEPEVVLAVNSRGDIMGAALGNDVNLRDVEGRSALLLGKAKDNNASCAIGPFIRLFDAGFTLDDVRRCVVSLEVRGIDGFLLQGSSSMAQISRDPQDLVRQTVGAHHQYPDGFMLFLGTMFAPVQDRGSEGSGFTHRLGDVVRIHSPLLGCLENTVTTSEQAAPWTFGVRALFANLAARGLLQTL
ncbi:MAG: fumarylacetoacetate hydrolase [Polaromonas sp.]|nr:fumarylacetoacetate hydrolase [Polaromonas sp.]